MTVLDIFSNDAFTMVSMSRAVDRVETVPRMLGELGVFMDNPIRMETVAVEDRSGTLSIIQTSQRGAPVDEKQTEKRKIRDFRTQRIAKTARITASELQFIREFGTEAQVMAVQTEIARRLNGPNGLLADVEATHENMRLGAMQGILTDADDAVLYNYYTEFGIPIPTAIEFDLPNTNSGALRALVQKEVVRWMRRRAKGAPMGGIVALCGDEFWDQLIANPEVRETYLNQQEASELRSGYDGETFDFAGVAWTNYVGTDDNSEVAIPDAEVKFMPAGQSGAFETAWAPGETFSAVGSLGQPVYAVIEPEQRQDPRYVDLEVYSYPLFLNKRPDMCRGGIAGT